MSIAPTASQARALREQTGMGLDECWRHLFRENLIAELERPSEDGPEVKFRAIAEALKAKAI